jgi:hypothetical protein
MAIFTLIISILGVVADVYPKAAPMVKDIYLMIKGEPVADITQAEFEARIDVAIARLPVWE